MKIQELIEKAKSVTKVNRLSNEAIAGEVGSALEAKSGKVYTGVSIHAACGIGFCAEHGAIGAMLTDGESEIKSIVAIDGDGTILPPCGRCRELLYEINAANMDTDVVVGSDKTVKLRELLPDPWQDRYKK